MLNSFFGVWLKDLVMFVCKIEFYIKNCVYSQLETFGGLELSQKLEKCVCQRTTLGGDNFGGRIVIESFMESF